LFGDSKIPERQKTVATFIQFLEYIFADDVDKNNKWIFTDELSYLQVPQFFKFHFAVLCY